MNKYEEIMLGRYGQRYIQYREVFKSQDIESDLDFPLHLDLDLVNACNLKCPTCHSIGLKRNFKSMEKELIQQIIEECNEYRMPAINIGGCCEPLIKSELTVDTLYKLKNTSFMDIFLHTNGVLLNKDLSKSLIDAGLTFLCVSIDAATQETFEKMRGAELNNIIENIENFLSVRSGELPVLRVSFLATSINIHEKDKFIEFWKDKADIVEVQNYIKSFDIQPDVKLTDEIKDRQPVSHRKEKRIAVVAPDYLCLTCNGFDVSNSIEQGNTFSKYSTIKNYWNNYVLKK
ncbi:MAG: radical SAM protein [Deferribacteraceae bacterium]|nr:radical SAM protein [Deferribacteraceae bacterium]